MTSMTHQRITLSYVFPTNTLVLLVVHNNYTTAAYMEHIALIKFQIHPFNLDQCLSNDYKISISDIYVIISVPLLQLRYID